jgi:hypothetical protein
MASSKTATVEPSRRSVELFNTAFDAEIEERIWRSDIDPSEWKASGRASQANPDKEDGAWWLSQGPGFVEAYVKWRRSISWVLWTTPAGEPAMELDLKCVFGDVPVRAILDRVFVTDMGELVVIDIKSGAQPPADEGLQLGFYASAMEVVFGIRPAWCAYWNARKGGISEPKEVAHLTPDYLGELLGGFVKQRDSGIYLPNPTSFCKSCGVRRACPLVNGPEAGLYLEIK